MRQQGRCYALFRQPLTHLFPAHDTAGWGLWPSPRLPRKGLVAHGDVNRAAQPHGAAAVDQRDGDTSSWVGLIRSPNLRQRLAATIAPHVNILAHCEAAAEISAHLRTHHLAALFHADALANL